MRLEERRVLAALTARGLTPVLVDDRQLAARLDDPAPRWDAVLNRSLSAQRRHVVGQLCSLWDVPVVNSPDVIRMCDDKVATSIALHRHGVATPVTAVGLSPDAGLAAIGSTGYPAVVKPVNGSWGRLLARVNDQDAAEAVLAHRFAAPSPQLKVVYAQEFVPTPGRDIRVLVADGHVVAAAYRESDHWAANRARGATMRACPVSADLEKLSLAAAEAVGGGFLGVDLLEKADALLVTEVNGTPEFAGLADTCDTDIAAALASIVAVHIGQR